MLRYAYDCRRRVYRIEPEYNPEDRAAAFKKALEWGERIPIGVIYRNNRPILEERIPPIFDKPLVKQETAPANMEKTLQEFY